METIFIPKVSVFGKYREICSDLAKFSALTGFVSSIPISTCDTEPLKKERRFTNFLRTLRNSLLRPARGEYIIIRNEEHEHTLFSSDTKSELSERKKALVELIKKHETAMLALRDARIQCWKSMAKIQKYQLMIETQQSALRYNQDEQKIRTAALKDTEDLLRKWMATHDMHHVLFEKKFLEELKYREKIQRSSADIQIDILEQMELAIRKLMEKNKQNISDADISKFACQLYKETCRSYSFEVTENLPCQQEWIRKPEYANSITDRADIERKIKTSQNGICMMAK